MQTHDTLRHPTGILEVRVFRHGQLIDSWRDENMILAAASDAVARLVGGDGSAKVIEKIGFGTNGNGPTPSDTDLTSPYFKAVSGHAYPAAGKVRFDWTLGNSEANGKVIRELALVCSDGSLFSRKTRGAIEKAIDISLSGSWTITF